MSFKAIGARRDGAGTFGQSTDINESARGRSRARRWLMAAAIAGCGIFVAAQNWADAQPAPSATVDDGYYQNAMSAIENRDYGNALQFLESARAVDPNSARVLKALGLVYGKLGRFDLSARYYGQAEQAELSAKAPVTTAQQPGTGPLITNEPMTAANAAMAPAPTGCTGPVDPYKNYGCYDAYLGDDVLTRLYNYYRLEWGEGGPPSDPNAPPGRRDGWPATPATTPPMPYTEFPYGAVTSIGVTRANSVDSPLMVAIANTGVGKWMADNDFQVYGWVDPGFNLSTNSRKFGNSPIGYTVNPNVGQLDQAVLYIDRFPDTVQTDHIDWGMRLSVIYGENYRYTEAYGIASSQFQGKNAFYGYDFPMAYGEVWIPQVFQGLMIRVGRYISIPDIEAQLAPNNILYTHSLTYTVDNYTNEGIVTSWQLTKNWLVQVGVVDGTEAAIWHVNQKMPNQYVQSGSNAAGFGPGIDPLYQGPSLLKDPGAQPSGVLCVRYESNDGNDVIYPCLDGINNGSWGFNNLQWHGFTYYHKFDDHWHLDFEAYYMSENGVPNGRNSQAVALFNNGGTPFSSPYVNFNAPNLAHCANSVVLKCDVSSAGAVVYLNYAIDPLNNLTFRPEYYWDPEGWRTGTGGYTQYFEMTFGWQHWLSPQIEFRPEVSYWRSFHSPAFNADAYVGIPANKFVTVEFASDVIIHF